MLITNTHQSITFQASPTRTRRKFEETDGNSPNTADERVRGTV